MDGAAKLERELRAYLGKQLRRVFSYSPVKRAVFALRQQPHGWACYICEGVSDNRRDFHVEHVSPVVPPDAVYITSIEYFSRMFCLSPGGVDLSNLQLCCRGCHAAKTKEEDALRKEHGTGRFSVAAREKATATRIRRGKKRKVSRARKAKRMA